VARFRQTENVDAVSSEQVARRVDFIPRQFFYRPDALPATQPTASKHLKHSFPGQLLNIDSEILNTGIAFSAAQRTFKISASHRYCFASLVTLPEQAQKTFRRTCHKSLEHFTAKCC